MSRRYSNSASLEPVRLDEGGIPLADSPPRSFSAAPDQDRALFRLDLRRSLQMHGRMALVIFLIGLVLAAAYFFRSWPTYSAESLIYVQPSPPKVLDGTSQRFPADSSSYESYLQQQIANVTRTDVLTGALHKLQPGQFQFAGESDQAAADRLSYLIEATRTGSYQFTIGAKAKKPQDAADLANAVTASYMDTAASEQKSGDAERLSVLRAELDRVQNELTADRSEQQTINQQLGVAAVGTGAPDLLDDDIARTRIELVKARTDRDEAEAKFAALQAGAGTSSSALDSQADDLAAADPGLVSMKTALNSRRAALITQMANLSPSHPEYKQDAAELTKINSSLDSMTRDLHAKAEQQLQQKLRAELEQTAGVEDRLNGQLRQLVGSTGATSTKMQRSSELSADIARLQARYSAVDEQIHNVLLEDGSPGAVFLTAAAVPPLHTAKSSALKVSVVIGGFFFGLAILSAIAAHKMDKRLYVASDVDQVLGFAPMAQWPDFDQVPDAVADEHVLRLASALEYAHNQGGLNSCMFTGTAAGVGATTAAVRVTDMLQALGRPTILMDSTGLDAEVEAPGRGNVRAQAASAGGRSLAVLQHFVREARTQNQSLLIADAAPLALSAETEHLARSVDCAIVLIESGVTTRAQLRAAANTLQRLDVGSVGFILNRIDPSKADDAFRNSLKDMEEHLRYQQDSSGKHTMRTRRLAAPSAAEAAAAAQETVRTQPAPAVAPSTFAQPAASFAAPPAPPRTFVPVASERASAAPPPAPARMNFPDFRPSIEPAPPASPSHPVPPPPPVYSDVPWWLSEEAKSVSDQSTMVPAPAAKARDAEKVPSKQRKEEAAARAREAETAGARKLEAELLAARQREAALLAEQMRRSQGTEPRHQAQVPEPRLSGLKNVQFSQGISNLGRARDAAPQHVEPLPLPQAEVPAAVPVYTTAHVVNLEPISAPETARVVTAPPEFLPPAEASRQDRRDAYDEVDILPSWRGQYRRRG